MGHSFLGFEPDGGVELGDGEVILALGRERLAQEEVGTAPVWLEADNLAVFGDGLVLSPQVVH